MVKKIIVVKDVYKRLTTKGDEPKEFCHLTTLTPKTKVESMVIRTTFRLEEEIRQALEDEAWKQRKSMNQLATEILRAYFEKLIKKHEQNI